MEKYRPSERESEIKTMKAHRCKRGFEAGQIVAVLLLTTLIMGCGKAKQPDVEPLQVEQENETEVLAEADGEVFLNEEQTTEQSSNKEGEDDNPAEEESTLTLIMAGDVLLHTPVSDSGLMADGTYNYDHLFANVKDTVENADIALVNQEVILGGRDMGLSGYPCFNGAYEVGDALSKAGFDVVLHATNHALDKGKKGILNCLAFWQNSHPQMKVVGINDSSEAQEEDFAVIEKAGIKVAVLNYTYGTNGIEMPQDAPYLVNMLDKEQIKRDVLNAKERADFIVVCPHWGIEYQHVQSKEQEEMAKYLSDLGVDLIIGTHPHVIQPVEWVEGEGGSKTLVYYSLGNFVNATSGTGDGVADRMLGAMAQVTLVRDEKDNVSIQSYGAKPLVSHVQSGPGGITVYPLDEYPEEVAMQNEIISQDSHFSIAYLKQVWNQVMGK